MNPAIVPQHLTLPVLTERIDDAALAAPEVGPTSLESSPGETTPAAAMSQTREAALQTLIAQELDAALRTLLPTLVEQVAQRVQARLRAASAGTAATQLSPNDGD